MCVCVERKVLYNKTKKFALGNPGIEPVKEVQKIDFGMKGPAGGMILCEKCKQDQVGA